MELILILIVVACSIAIVLIQRKAKRETHFHVQKITALQDVIVVLLKNQMLQQDKVDLAETMKKTIQHSNAKLNNDIVALQYEFVEILKQNGLLP